MPFTNCEAWGIDPVNNTDIWWTMLPATSNWTSLLLCSHSLNVTSTNASSNGDRLRMLRSLVAQQSQIIHARAILNYLTMLQASGHGWSTSHFSAFKQCRLPSLWTTLPSGVHASQGIKHCINSGMFLFKFGNPLEVKSIRQTDIFLILKQLQWGSRPITTPYSNYFKQMKVISKGMRGTLDSKLFNGKRIFLGMMPQICSCIRWPCIEAKYFTCSRRHDILKDSLKTKWCQIRASFSKVQYLKMGVVKSPWIPK